MKLKNLKKCVAALTACVVLSAGMTVMPADVGAASNIISNSTFDSGLSGWSSFKQSGGAYTLTTQNGKLAMNITSVGTLNYSVQFGYDIVPLYQNGVYRLSYEISSTSNRTVEAMIQENGGTYQTYTWKSLDLTSQPQTVDYTFTMKQETDIMAKLAFNCGFYEGEDPGSHTIYLDNVVLELVDDSNVDYSQMLPYEAPIITNQIGYKKDSKKIAVFRNINGEKEFSVVNADTDKTVYTGELYGEKSNSSANETNWFGDFSSVTEEGNYYIKCGNLDDSYQFKIGDNIYDNLLDDSVKMLYLQRCGTAVEDDTFGHPSCHDTKAVIYGTNQTIDVNGGWHDAGDYGRYIVPAAKSIADLLYAYQTNPELYSDSIGIPESGNGVPDILDEVRYELEWMLKMQAESGGVYHKVTCEDFPGYVMPQNETNQLIVTPVSTTATADFCASMAMAYEFYKDIDSTFANKCLDAAKKAWSFLEANPNLIFDNPDDITTGEYGDKSDTDERYWATAQMYRATGGEEYLTKLERTYASSGLDWALVGHYGAIALVTMDGINTSSSAYTKARDSILSYAGTYSTAANNSSYGVSVSKFNWGSNMTVANAGIILGVAYQLTGEEKYITAAESNLNYLLGNNPNGVCYVTGYGTVSPQCPHHRPSMVKNQPMKGMLVGGVNSSLEDNAAKAYLINSPAAKCYIDNWESYSTNEITIYWNSPLTYLLSLTEPTAAAEEETVPGDVNLDGTVNNLDVKLLQEYLINKSKLTAQQGLNADVFEDGKLNIFDVVSLKHQLAGGNGSNNNNNNNNDDNNDDNNETVIGPNESATLFADFRKGSSSAFYASDGWSNGSCFDCVWRGSNAVFKDNALNLTIDKDTSGQYNYSGAEYRTNDFYGYGYYETSMKAIKNNGVVSSFFTYTGPSDNNPWDEIDIEILGKDTTKVQFNYYTNGVGNHEYFYDLGFDASEGFHTYGFDWQPDHITWYVDGEAVYTANSNIPSTAGRIMMNVWPGTGVDDWLNAYDGKTPLTAQYQWVTYDNK